jgi:hypothetical protein
VFAGTALAGLFVGLLIGAVVGSTYAVARRGWADLRAAKEIVTQAENDARAATRNAVGWIGIGVLLVVVAVACVAGTGRHDGADPGDCAPVPATALAAGRSVGPAPGLPAGGPVTGARGPSASCRR